MGYNVLARRLPVATRHAIVCYPDNRRLDAGMDEALAKDKAYTGTDRENVVKEGQPVESNLGKDVTCSSSTTRLRPRSWTSTGLPHETQSKAWPLKKVPSISSQNYEAHESEVARLYELEQRTNCHSHMRDETTSSGIEDEQDGNLQEVGNKILRWQTRKRSLLRWLVIFFIAIAIETLYLFISYSSATLVTFRTTFTLQFQSGWSKYLIKLILSCLYAVIAFLMVYLVPASAGSGIPETKAFLNGIRIPDIQSLSTLTAKVFGTIFAVAAGLPVGKYGPMIHIGSIVAACTSRRARLIRPVDRLLEAARVFSNHSERRDLVVAGAAAGVTAAFAAPIGGLLLAWEEGSSYWSLKVTWRVFFCATGTLLFTYLLAGSRMGPAGASLVDPSYMQSYAGSFSTGIRVANEDLLLFVGMGVLGGILGAAFNALHWHMSRLRHSYVCTWPRRLMEVLGVTVLVSTVGFLASFLSESWACRPVPPAEPSLYEDAAYVVPYLDKLLPLTCGPGYYNEVASLYLNDGVSALRLLFHLPRLNLSDDKPMFSLYALALFAGPYFLFLVLAFGVSVPSGFFVPQLLLGAALGRMAGQVVVVFGHPTYLGQVRVFAIMGSAAFVGGITRMVPSMTVIMLEATGNLFFLLPFALVLLSAHWVGDLFTPSIYDMIIEIKGYPFLRPDPPKWALAQLRARDLMTPQVVSLRPIETVKRVQEVLCTTGHNMFPLLYPSSHPTRSGALFGTIMRETLVVLLQAANFSSTASVNNDPDNPELASPVLDFAQLLESAARLSSRVIAQPVIPLTPEDESKWMDLRPYSNPSVYFVTEDSSVTKVYRLFRGLGLRHLLVLNIERDVCGVIARHDLMPNSMESKLRKIKSCKNASKAHWTLPKGIQGRKEKAAGDFVKEKERGKAPMETGGRGA